MRRFSLPGLLLVFALAGAALIAVAETTGSETDSVIQVAGSELGTGSASIAPPSTTEGAGSSEVASSSTDTDSPGDSAPTTSIPGDRSLTMAFSGDVIPHAPVVRQAAANASVPDSYDFAPMFDRVRPIITDADLAICHLETPISLTNSDISGYPVFNAPVELVDGLSAAGFDGCSTASNHSMDRGANGVTSTLTALSDSGLGHAGMARSSIEGVSPTLYEADDLTIGHLSYTYGLNGFELPADQPWLVDVIDRGAIEREATAARVAGADFVVLSMHWGAEYQTDPTAEQVQLAGDLAGHPDIDLIVGHHAHVVQPVAQLDVPVVYGMGNFLSNQSASCCVAASQDGVIVRVTIDELPTGGFETDIEYVPTWVDRSNYVIMPTASFVAENPASSLVVPLTDSWSRTVSVMGSMGAAAEPVGPAPGA